MADLNFLDPNPSGFPLVLLLHGLGANASSWTLQFDPLIAAWMRPVAPDAPGFGASRYDGRGWSFKRVAALLAGLLDELHSGPVYLVGLSMGGVIAQRFVLDYPQRVQKLVLVSTFSALRPSNFSQLVYFLRRVAVTFTLGPKQQAEAVARRVFPAPGQEALREMAAAQFASADPRAYRAAMRSLGLFDSHKRLKEIKVPTLVITGANDTTVSPDRQQILAKGICGARQVIIRNAGHAVAIDQAEMFNRELLDFLG
jgi:3-oxoadipate enol-lactonase